MRRLTVVLLAAFSLSATVLAVGPAPGGAATGRSRAPLAGSHPAWATPATKVGDARKADRMQVRVYLKLRDAAGAEATARSVSDPNSASYGRFLSASAVLARFGPTTASVAAVRSWLGSAGMKAGYVPTNRMFVEATGTVAQAEKAFGTKLGVYAVRGHKLRGPAGDLSLPADLAGVVTSVIGADQSLNLLTPDHIAADPGAATASSSARNGAATNSLPKDVPPADGFRNATPCSTYWGEKTAGRTLPSYPGYGRNLPYSPCGYKPAQLRSAYGTQSLLDRGLSGRGAKVAVIDAFASPTIFADASEYARRNDPAHPLKASQFSQLVFPVNADLEGPDECDAAGWYGEESLDIEAVHAMAPGADILYVGGSDCEDLSIDKALNEVVSKQLAPIVSNSYGDLGEDVPADEVAGFQQIAIEAVLQGIGLYFSSGDDGDESLNLDQVSADFSATSPWVTAVGGTSLGVGRDGRKVFETGWETGKSTFDPETGTYSDLGYVYGSGGGTSRLFAEPFYQRGIVPDSLARKNQTGRNRGRVVPDISMVGDPNTGMLVGQTQTFPDGVYYDQYRIGGTSLSCPLMAGMMALADSLTGHPHGFINPTLYFHTARAGGVTDVKHVKGAEVREDFANGIDAADGLVTSIRTFDYQDLAIHTRRGYDDTTGLGTPNGLRFLTQI